MSESTVDQRVGLCLECNCALRGLSENRCPDCGQAFEPDDPDTMNMGRPISPQYRSLLRLPSLRWAKVAIVASLLTLGAIITPGSHLLLLLPLSFVWFVIGLRWFYGCSVFYLVAWHYQQPQLFCGAALKRWAVIPAVTVVTILLLAVDAPSRLHFLATRHSFERLAQRAVRGEPVSGDHWVGLIKVGDVRSDGGEVSFTVRGSFLSGTSGFVYHPSGRPQDDYGYHVYPLWGDWYTWEYAS